VEAAHKREMASVNLVMVIRYRYNDIDDDLISSRLPCQRMNEEEDDNRLLVCAKECFLTSDNHWINLRDDRRPQTVRTGRRIDHLPLGLGLHDTVRYNAHRNDERSMMSVKSSSVRCVGPSSTRGT
jgi:hypothetical protein